jgi:hypothetical protein
MGQRIFSASFDTSPLNGPMDILSLQCAAQSEISLHAIFLSAVFSDGQPPSTAIRLRFRRGVGSALGSGGTILTPCAMSSDDPPAVTICHACDTTQAVASDNFASYSISFNWNSAFPLEYPGGAFRQFDRETAGPNQSLVLDTLSSFGPGLVYLSGLVKWSESP